MKPVLVIPSLDIFGGRLARLREGEMTAGADETPLDAARRFVADGAPWLHVVDVDGARTGVPANLEIVRRVAALGVPVQSVGGIRDEATADRFLQAGVARIVVAADDDEVLSRLARRYGERLAATIYVRDGRSCASPWSPPSREPAADALARVATAAVRTAIYADVAAAGTLTGADLERVAAASAAYGGDLLYSGGIGSLDDIRALARQGAVRGVIVGKALDLGRFTLPAALHEALTAAGRTP